MRSQISQAWAHASDLRDIRDRLRNLAKQVVGEVPHNIDQSPQEAYPASLPMTEELRFAVRDSEQPLREIGEAVLWLEQMFGVETPLTPATKTRVGLR